jgi:hypothetical protein
MTDRASSTSRASRRVQLQAVKGWLAFAEGRTGNEAAKLLREAADADDAPRQGTGEPWLALAGPRDPRGLPGWSAARCARRSRRRAVPEAQPRPD